jgi:hypothetical protein
MANCATVTMDEYSYQYSNELGNFEAEKLQTRLK